MKPGLPELSAPPFSATVGNHTYTFSEMASTLGSAIFVVPLLSILENIALAKVFCKLHHASVYRQDCHVDISAEEYIILMLTHSSHQLCNKSQVMMKGVR